MPLLVEHEIRVPQHVAGKRAAGAAQDRLDTGDDLGEANGFVT